MKLKSYDEKRMVHIKNKNKTQQKKPNVAKQQAKTKEKRKEKKRERPIANPVKPPLKPPHAREIHRRPVAVSTVGVAYTSAATVATRDPSLAQIHSQMMKTKRYERIFE